MSVTRILGAFVAMIIVVGFIYMGITDAIKTKDNLQVQKIELKSKQSDLKELNVKYEQLNHDLDKATEQKGQNQSEVERLRVEKEELNKQKLELEAQLQAKIEQKTKLAAASNKVIAAATVTSSASAGTPSNVQSIIIAAANKYGVSSSHMLQIAKCESTYNPLAQNKQPVIVRGVSYGYAKGLFQFIDSTWTRMSSQAGYAGASVWDATANANVAAWAFSTGHAGEWQCR